MEEEANRVPDLDCTMGAEKHSRKWTISNGDFIDLPRLLFTKNRDYLITNTNEQVRAEQLAGKVIGLYFVPLFYASHHELNTSLLLDVYNTLRSSNGFEIVFVPLHGRPGPHTSINVEKSHRHYFEKLFSCMPWTSIPFSDIASSKSLQTRFDVGCPYNKLFVIDSTCIVLQCHALEIVKQYGALGYPFSDERVKFLTAEDDAIINKPSLKTLLGSPHRDFVISNEGEKVPIHTLEDKVVALYFYEHEVTQEGDTEELKMVYEELAKTKKNFEVVLIYLHDTAYTYNTCTEESFWKDFKTMPWLALPFKDPNLKKLQRIFEYCQIGESYDWFPEPQLVIFGPHGEYIEPFGMDILYRYKIPAYPFTRNKVAKLEAEKAQELRLEMLWDPETVFRRTDGSQVTFSQLSGKRVIVLFEGCIFTDAIWSRQVIQFLRSLKKTYFHKRGSDDEFEVIHIIIRKTESRASVHVGDMPWLLSHELPVVGYGSYFFDDAILCDLLDYYPTFAFGRDGRLVRRTLSPIFRDKDFPFHGGGLEHQAWWELTIISGWNYWDYYAGFIHLPCRWFGS